MKGRKDLCSLEKPIGRSPMTCSPQDQRSSVGCPWYKHFNIISNKDFRPRNSGSRYFVFFCWFLFCSLIPWTPHNSFGPLDLIRAWGPLLGPKGFREGFNIITREQGSMRKDLPIFTNKPGLIQSLRIERGKVSFFFVTAFWIGWHMLKAFDSCIDTEHS